MTYVIVCGGTAGHINPGISIAKKLQERRSGCRILFFGADRELEKRLIPQAGFELINFRMSGIKRGFSPQAVKYNVKTIINVLSAEKRALQLLCDIKPEAVIGTGGYICYPIIKAAKRLKIPSFVHESNALPGMTVRRLSGIADKVMVTYPGYDRYYKKPERIVITGTPVREEFFSDTSVAADTAKNKEDNKPLVVSFWGSLGAGNLNDMMENFITRNAKDKSFCHIHAAGSIDALDKLKNALERNGVIDIITPYTDIREYIDNLPDVIKSSDLVLCRAGGITLSELAAAGKPGILIPSPYVPDNVQHENAMQLKRCNAAVILDELETDGDKLYNETIKLLGDRERLQSMSNYCRQLAKPKAADDIADIILDVRGHRSGAENR